MSDYYQPQGRVLWLTGFSGAGKTTIAKAIQLLLIDQGIVPVVLDGDLVRAAIDDPQWKFDEASRLMGSYRYSRLALLAAEQGGTVIVPTISLFHEVQAWNREHLPSYFEVLVETSEHNRRCRDHKALYAESNTSEMFGINITAQLPEAPDLIVCNDGTLSNIEKIAERIVRQFLGENE